MCICKKLLLDLSQVLLGPSFSWALTLPPILKGVKNPFDSSDNTEIELDFSSCHIWALERPLPSLCDDMEITE